MIAGIDSAFPPTLSQAKEAYAAGVRLWSGYLASRPGVGLYHAWSETDFAIVREAGHRSIAYCSGDDDPVACATLARMWGVMLCLDVERGIRADGSWVQEWVDAAGCGLYGNAPVFAGRSARFFVVSQYPGGDPFKTWNGPRPLYPTGWQWQGTHTEFGCAVDRGNFDDWFGGQDDMVVIVNTPAEGQWALANGLYFHVTNGPNLTSLRATGACAPAEWTVDQGQHDEIKRAATQASGAVPTGITLTGSLHP